MLIKSTPHIFLAVHAGKEITFVTNILKADKILGVPERKTYETHVRAGGVTFEVKSKLSLRHAYIAAKSIQSIFGDKIEGSLDGIVEMESMTIRDGHMIMSVFAYILEDDETTCNPSFYA